MSKHTEQTDPSGPRITRRCLLVKGGVALVGTTLLGFPFDLTRAQEMAGDDLKRRGIMSKGGGMKPTFLPDEGSRSSSLPTTRKYVTCWSRGARGGSAF